MQIPFYIIPCAYARESEGQIKELTRTVNSCKLERLYDGYVGAETLDTVGEAVRVKKGGVYLVEKPRNPDIIRAVRILLAMEAGGVVIEFGNNPVRGYIKDGSAYSAREFVAAVDEVKRLAPLFGRRTAQP